MKHSFTAIRAIGTEFARRTYGPIAIIAVVLDVLLVAAMIGLLTISAWWLLLAIPVFIAVIVSAVLLLVVWLLIGFVSPSQTAHQKREVKRFVDKLQSISEVVQTPKLMLLFRIVKDIAAPRKDGFIQATSNDTLSLKKDFLALQRSFDQNIIQ